MLIFRSAKANAAALGLLLRASRKWGAWWGKNKTKFIRGVKEDAGIVLLIGAGASQLGLLGLWALSAFGGQGAWPQGEWQKAGLLSGALAGCALRK